MNNNNHDLHYLECAFELAKKGEYTASPNPCVGCVLVKGETIIGEGWHQYSGQAHAEVNAIADAINKGYQTTGSTAYVTLEPCNHTGKTSPCTEALIAAKITRVVIALMDVDARTAGQGVKKLQANGIEVDTQAAQDSAVQQKVQYLCRGYLNRHNKGRPHVRLKIASSLDGKVALHNGLSQWITGEEAREDVQLLRCQSDAILTTSHTIKADNPRFTIRLSDDQKQQLELGELTQAVCQPALAILNSDLSLVLNSELNFLHSQRDIWIFYAEQLEPQQVKNFEQSIHTIKQIDKVKADIKVIPVATMSLCSNKTSTLALDLSQVLLYLGENLVNNVLVESGSQLNGALIEGHRVEKSVKNENFYPLVDECIYYLNSKVMGSEANNAFNTSVISRMQDVYSLRIESVKRLSEYDIKLVLSW